MSPAIDRVGSGAGAVLAAADASPHCQAAPPVGDAMLQPWRSGLGAARAGRLLLSRAAVRGRCPAPTRVFFEFGCQP